MRGHFLIGIVGSRPPPFPLDIADFVIDWNSKPMILAIKFCPFCGKKIDHSESLRNMQVPPPAEDNQ